MPIPLSMRQIKYLAFPVLLFAWFSSSVVSQGLTGEVRLEVKDPSGAAMYAAGLLEGLSTGIRTDFQTDDRGEQTFGRLPFGRYRLLITSEGFANKELLIEVRSEAPLHQPVTMTLQPLLSNVEIRAGETLLNPVSAGATQHIGADFLAYRKSSMPGRSVLDAVNVQPGWLLEANGILHPRGFEYDVQYVIDGIPLYDNRSPAFAQTLGIDDFDNLIVRTANYPAEYGRKLGGVIEVNTVRDPRQGIHGQFVLQGGSFRQRSAFISTHRTARRNSFSLSGEAMMTDRYLDPPVVENHTNRGSGGGFSGRFERTWSVADSSRFYFHQHRTGFLVPNERLQELAGQRQDRTAGEKLGQFSHTHLFSAQLLVQARAMFRSTSAKLWSNEFSTPILPDQDRGFREGYVSGNVSLVRGSHEWKVGGDALYTTIRENFGFGIGTRRIGGVRIFDGDVPSSFRFNQKRNRREKSVFIQDLWHRGRITASAGLRFDHYNLALGESAWSPRFGIAYNLAPAGVVLRASYDRVFQEPAVENILLASTNLVEELGGEGAFIPLAPGRGNFVEAGFSKLFLDRLRFDGTWYHRIMENFSDDGVLFNTGVSFPIAFMEGRITGYEAKIEMPGWGALSGFVSYANMTATGSLPVTGGLFLGDEAEEALGENASFPITQDQRNTVRSRLRLQAASRLWFALGAAYNSGLPFEIEGPTNTDFIIQQYGPAIIRRINFERRRVRPSAFLDASIGLSIIESERGTLRVQTDVFNLTDRLNVINFSGIFSGTAIDAGRSFSIRLNATF